MKDARLFQKTIIVVTGLILGLAPAIVLAQATSTGSQITGVVKDSSGAVIPGASVTITDVNTSIAKTVLSGADGSYTVTSLPPDPYTLKVTKAGFKTYEQSGIVLQINTNPAINVTMQVGSVDTQVVVEAGAAMVETQNANVSQVINPQQVVDLPLNGRQADQLIALSGAAVNTNGGGGLISSGLDYPTTVSYSIAGSQPASTNYYLDGSQHLDFRDNVGLPMPFPDALSEFSVNISALPANLGIRPGGTINAVTRSGSNAFHGNIFDFVRNGVMDATTRTYTNRSGVTPSGVRDSLVRNQFGGTIGGPIKKDKIFFFGGYQGTIANSTTGEATGTTPLPTAAMIAGDLSALYPSAPGGNKSTAGCSAQTINTTYAPNNATYQTNNSLGNQISPAYLTTASAQVMQAFTSYIPSGVFLDKCGDYAYQALPNYNFESQYVGRVDWQRTASDSIFGRYFLSKYSQPAYLAANNVLSSNGDGLQEQIQTASIGDTHVLSARSINTLTLAFDRTATVRNSNPKMPTDCSLGSNVTCMVPNELYMIILEPGFQGYDYENSWGFTNGYSWTGGKHQFNAGVALLHVQMNGTGQFQMDPELTFTTGTYTGATLGDAVTGNVDGLLQGMGQLSRDGQNQPSAYVQDAYKVLPRLQLTGGLRWDPFFAQHNKYGEVTDWTLAGYEAGTRSQVFTNAPPGQTFEGDAGFHGHSDTNNYTKTFAPRLGFVWDITGKGTETLRGGYGIFYDTSVIWNTMHVVLDPPFGETLSFTPLGAQQGGGLANPFAGVNGPNPFPFYNPSHNFVFPANGAFVFQNQTNRPSNVQQWNLAFQRQMSANLLLTVNYIGNKTSHVWLGITNNPDQYLAQYGTTGSCTIPYNVPGSGIENLTYTTCNEPSGTTEYDTTGFHISNANARKALNLINPTWGATMAGGALTDYSFGDGSYNGLLVSVEKRMSHGFSVLGNYTWSHCMDNGEVGEDVGNVAMNPADPKNSSWGNCSYNDKEIGNLTIQGQTPHFADRMVNSIVSNWSGSGIFTAQTGTVFSVTDNYDISLTGVGLDRPNVVGNPYRGGTIAANPTCNAPAQVKTQQYWFNPCAFAYSSAGTFGNEVRNSIVGPANWNLNLAIWRSFPLPERVHLDFRAEAFNALNHTQYGNPATASSEIATSGTNANINSNAGLINTSNVFYGPRIFQLAIKANF